MSEAKLGIPNKISREAQAILRAFLEGIQEIVSVLVT